MVLGSAGTGKSFVIDCLRCILKDCCVVLAPTGVAALTYLSAQDEFSAGETQSEDMLMRAAVPVRYLLYEVNPGEGFNLRRDVYLRVANMAKFLNAEEGQQWVVVLPPWGNIYHWKSKIHQSMIPWSKFFDLESLRKHVPVIELADWMKVVGTPSMIDEIYYLQHYAEGWENGEWKERRHIRPCIEHHGFVEDDDGITHGWFWGYDPQILAKKFACLSVQNEISTFVSFLKNETSGQSVLVHRAESLTHGRFSEWSKEWWMARRSVRFSGSLTAIANKFRKEYLDSDDERDLTVQDPDWTKQQKTLGEAKGGPYLAVHLRRQDFLRSTMKELPSLESAAAQIEELLTKHKLNKVFIATDAPPQEFEEVKNALPGREVYRFTPTKEELKEIGDGGVAIIDQWIAAHARYFTGTSTSTFSFRIHEERALLGFPEDNTYNRICGEKENKQDCQSNQPGRWLPNYG